MKHLYTTTEVAQLIIYIENNSEKLSFSKGTYEGKKLIKLDIDEVQNKISKFLDRYQYVFNFDFLFDEKSKNYKPRKFTPIEAHFLAFFMIYPSGNYSFISKAKNKKEVTSDELFTFYNELRKFLKDERFHENGAWYNFEKEMLKQLPEHEKLIKYLDEGYALETTDEFIDSHLRQAFNFTYLKYLKEEIERKAICAVKTGLEELIPKEIFSTNPFITSPDLYLEDKENFTDEELEQSFDFGFYINSGYFKGNDFEWTTEILQKFNNEITDTILYLFKHLHTKPISEEELNRPLNIEVFNDQKQIDYITQLLKK